MNDLKGKNIIVTGASGGIGNSIVEFLYKSGANILASGTKIEKLEKLKSKFENIKILRFDISHNDKVEEFIDNCFKELGERLDCLVNNAGITRDNILLRMKEDEWEDIINTNLSSIYKMSKSVLRGMIKNRSGRIISITSVVGAMGNAGQSNYAAAKAGIIGFTKSLAREVGVRGITVNAIAPGFIETDMTSSLPDNQKEALASQIPMGRLGTADEIAQAVLFLASDGGSYITGQTLHVNGGMYSV